MRRFIVCVYTFIIGVMFAGLSHGQTADELYGMVFEQSKTVEFGETTDENTNKVMEPLIAETVLYKIDPETGQTIRIGGTGLFQCTGMDFHPRTRQLYAVCSTGDVGSEEVSTKLEGDDIYLVRINTMTGDATEIGPTGVVPALGASVITDLSFRSDGTLFGHALTKDGSILGTIDTRTGEFKQLGLFAAEIRPGGLAFSAGDQLYSADTYIKGSMAAIHMRNQLNGDGAIAANLNLTLEEGQFPFVTTMDLNPADGMIYGYLFDQGVAKAVEINAQRVLELPYIVVIDPETGDVDFRTPVEEQVFAIAFMQPLALSNVPTMGEWGLIALAGLMLAGSVMILSRRQKRSAA